MAGERLRLRALLWVGAGLALVFAGVLLVRDRVYPNKPIVYQTRSATAPSTHPSSAPTEPERPPRTYMELVLKHYPSFPTTQPLKQNLTIKDAGHILIPDPFFLDGRGVIWITRADAEETETLLPIISREQVVLTRERVLFVMWTVNEAGEWSPNLVVKKGDGFELVDARRRRVIGRGKSAGYDWSRAFRWEEKMIVVPTDAGAAIFVVGKKIIELVSPPLAGKDARVEIQADVKGLLAWRPGGGSGVARFVDNQWQMLTAAQGWPAGIVHLIPLLDGSVIQLVASDEETMRLNVVSLDAAKIDEKAIALLVIQLGEADPAVREKAYAELTRYGPGVFPVAEKMMVNALPEAQDRLKELLRARISPLLGGMRIVDGKLKVVARLPDGGAVFYAERGVAIPRGDEEALVIVPAWLSIRPGTAVQRLDAEMMHDLDPAKIKLTAVGAEWVMTNEVSGPQRFIGGAWAPLLRKNERAYSEFAGIDAVGRYIFRKSGEAGALVLDPTLPDPTPRLPVWQIVVNKGTAGWSKDDWPAQKEGEHTWALGVSAWKAMDEEKKEPFFSTPEQVPAIEEYKPAASTRATTTATTREIEKPLLHDAEGSWYFDGKTKLKVIRRDGSQVVWPLPAVANGEGEVRLVQAKDGVLYLFNQPGRVLRIKATPGGPEAFKLEATFTRKIPNVSNPTRIWLDPFNRIVIAYEGNRLAILFPEGFIPQGTQGMMLVGEEDVGE